VSDIKVYNPDKWEESRAEGTLRREFRDEILKSWEEYVEQVGEEMAKKTPYFRDALNDILAGGERVF
jgi:TRAP-type mannitol/chloroaromatic compound transport system substrate-binding protein